MPHGRLGDFVPPHWFLDHKDNLPRSPRRSAGFRAHGICPGHRADTHTPLGRSRRSRSGSNWSRPSSTLLLSPVAGAAMAPAIDPGAAACASQRAQMAERSPVVSVPLGAGCQSGFLIWRRSRVAGVRGAGEAIGGHPLFWPCLCAPSRPVCGGQATSTRESARGPPRSPTLRGPLWPSVALCGPRWPSLALSSPGSRLLPPAVAPGALQRPGCGAGGRWGEPGSMGR